MIRAVSMLVVVVILLACCSAAFGEVLVAAAEPAADGQRAYFKVVNVSKPVCLAVFQANDAGSLLTLTTYYLKTLQTIQAAPPMVLHYKTTAFFALFEPVGGTSTACMAIPTSFLSDPNRAPAIYETLAGGDGPPVTIVQLAGALNVAQQNCSAGNISNSSAGGGVGGMGGAGTGGSAGAGGNGIGGNSVGGVGTGGNAGAGGNGTGGDAITSGGGSATGGAGTGGNSTGGAGYGGNSTGGAGYGGNSVGGAGTGGAGGNGTGGSISISGNCNGNSNVQNSTILQSASAIVTFGFEEIDFRPADDTALSSALVNCSAPSIQTAGSSMTVSCKLPTTGGTFSTQTFH